MPQNTHLKLMTAESERLNEVAHSIHAPEILHKKAEDFARNLTWLPSTSFSSTFDERIDAVTRALKPILEALDSPPPAPPISDDFRWLYDNGRLLYTELTNLPTVLKSRKKMPHVRT